VDHSLHPNLLQSSLGQSGPIIASQHPSFDVTRTSNTSTTKHMAGNVKEYV